LVKILGNVGQNMMTPPPMLMASRHPEYASGYMA
jgi:hypothetical protein